MIPIGKSSLATEEDRAFLQRRIMLFGFLSGGIYFFFLMYRAIASSFYGHFVDEVLEASFLYHALTALSLLAMAITCLGKERSLSFLRTIEAVGLLSSVVFTGLMGVYIPIGLRPDFILVMALQSILMIRAVLVPSSGLRTASIAGAVGVPLLVMIYVAFLDPRALKIWRASVFEDRWMEFASAQQVAAHYTLEMGIWWLSTIFITSATSRVIYGLRKDIRSARRLGQYRLETKIGEGGMGEVYRASHAMLRRPTAIKLLHPKRTGTNNLRRFEAEVQQTSQLRHPSIITIFDYGHTLDGVFYYAMEYIDGHTLSALVELDGPQHPGRVLQLWIKVCRGLIEAHGRGLIHRDIKPSNIMIYLPHRFGGTSEAVKLLDFGLVKKMRQDGGIELTHADSLSGTPQYMAPEVIRDPEQVDARSDLYALGAVAYYLITGTHVFEGKNAVDVCAQHLHSAPEPPSVRLGKAVPAPLEALILACLEKDSDSRPASATSLIEELKRCQSELDDWGAKEALAWWNQDENRVTAPQLVSEVKDGDEQKQLLTVDLNPVTQV